MLNEQIRTLRTARNMTQVDLAKVLNVTKQSVSNWENDNIQPSIDMLVKIASYFSVSCDYLLGIDQKRYLDVTGLTESETTHIQQIIADIISAKAKSNS